jgi:hypothetical protein
MVEWLEKFAQSRTTKKMNRTASQVIVDKDKFPDAEDGDTVDFENQKYKVVNSKFADADGEGVVLESIDEDAPVETTEEVAAEETHVEPDVMDVAMGTSPAYDKHKNKAQEYANVDPEVNDPDPRDDEVAKFEEEAKATEEAIAAEDAIDGTSGATKPNRILQRMYDSGAFEKATEEEEAPAVSDDDVIDLETFDFDDDVEFGVDNGETPDVEEEAPVEEDTDVEPETEEVEDVDDADDIEDIVSVDDEEEIEETEPEDSDTDETVEEDADTDVDEDDEEEVDIEDIASLTNEFNVVSSRFTNRLRKK